MAQVWNALNSLSQTVGNRGGISDAMLRGADASLGLKRAEYEIARGQKADAMRQKEFDLGLPEKEIQAQKAQKRLELVPVKAQEIFPQDISGITHTMTPRSGDGKSLYDDLDKGLPGSGWNDKGHRVNKDGAEVMIPRWQLEEQYLPSSMALYTARMDPIKKLNDKLFEIDESLKTVDPNDQEYQTIKGKSDLIKKTLSDPNQLAPLYAKKASLLQDQIAWGILNNVRQDFINIMKSEADKAEANFQKYSVKMTPEQRQVFDLDIQKKKADIETIKAHGKAYERSNRGTGGKGSGGGKPPSFTEQMKRGENKVKRFSMKHGLSGDGLDVKIFTEEEKNALESEAAANGLDVFFDEAMVPDQSKENDYIPFNSRNIKGFTVRGVMTTDEDGAEQNEESNAPTINSPEGVDFNSLLERGKAVSGKATNKAPDRPTPIPQAKSENPPQAYKTFEQEPLTPKEQRLAEEGRLDKVVSKRSEKLKKLYASFEEARRRTKENLEATRQR